MPLALGLTLSKAGTCPLACLHSHGQLGHPVQLGPLLGRDGRCRDSARLSLGSQHDAHAILSEPLLHGGAEDPQRITGA